MRKTPRPPVKSNSKIKKLFIAILRLFSKCFFLVVEQNSSQSFSAEFWVGWTLPGSKYTSCFWSCHVGWGGGHWWWERCFYNYHSAMCHLAGFPGNLIKRWPGFYVLRRWIFRERPCFDEFPFFYYFSDSDKELKRCSKIKCFRILNQHYLCLRKRSRQKQKS